MSIKAHINRDWQDKLTGATYMFAGLNNVVDPYNMLIEKGWMPFANNVDIDNTNSISRRDGYTSKVATTTAHSGWANDKKAYFVDDIYLKEFDGTTTRIVDVVTKNSHMWYEQCNDVVAYSNGYDSGLIGGSFSQTSTYSPYFKEQTNLGICLCFYNGRLYHAIDNKVYCTDVFDIEHSDIRQKHVLTVRTPITMIRAVEDGLYVGSQRETHYLKGNDPVDGGYDLIIIANYGVIIGTDITTSGEYFPEAKASGRIAIWTSVRGICTGGENGNFNNHSVGIVSIPEATSGSALLRDKDGYRQYLVTLDSSTPYNAYPTPTWNLNLY